MMEPFSQIKIMSSKEVEDHIKNLKSILAEWDAFIELYGTTENLQNEIKSYEWLLNG